MQSGQLSELHPADIAEIVHQLTPGQGARLIEGLDNETAADTMEEIDTERQRLILENIQSDRAADILDAMGPDEAADLLSLLSEERAQELLKLMQPEESEEVQDLLEYDEDSAGGLMTTDYIALNATKTVADAIEAVRSAMREEERQAYVYCVPDETADEYRLTRHRLALGLADSPSYTVLARHDGDQHNDGAARYRLAHRCPDNGEIQPLRCPRRQRTRASSKASSP